VCKLMHVSAQGCMKVWYYMHESLILHAFQSACKCAFVLSAAWPWVSLTMSVCWWHMQGRCIINHSHTCRQNRTGTMSVACAGEAYHNTTAINHSDHVQGRCTINHRYKSQLLCAGEAYHKLQPHLQTKIEQAHC
jgi:hypothetical protein